MREPLVKHQIIEYRRNEPFYVGSGSREKADGFYAKNSHWHEELEIAYVERGHYQHYIDGECIQAEPGRLIVTNCENVHRIFIPREGMYGKDSISTIILIVHNRFIEDNFPEYRDFLFTNNKTQARPEVREIMRQFAEYEKKKEREPHEHLYMRGLLLQLLFYLYQEGAVNRNANTSKKHNEQVQTLKEILQYVENHYREPIIQADIAKEFYFTPQYFAHYFKKITGTTFVEHLTAYRVQQARIELLHTNRRISDIARNNGFNDDRSFINAFKKVYNVTPLQYRKIIAQNN